MFCSSCGSALAEKAVIRPKCGCPTENYMKPQEVSGGAIAASYIAGAIIPLIGWVMAIYLLVKCKVGHAIGVAAVSIFMAFFWYGFFGALVK
ncbi:hypothetical protein FJY63_12945 [Candidatus Sumerlaeota bacterium]|nr:hypothetical protein [Candidatus Sumerlaeota bacterium]